MLFFSLVSTASGANIPADFKSTLAKIAHNQSLSLPEIALFQQRMFTPSIAEALLEYLSQPASSSQTSSALSHFPLISGSSIPFENRSNTFENFDMGTSAALTAIKGDLEKFAALPPTESRMLYMHGAPGRGKTHLTISLANMFAAQGKKVLWLKADDMLNYASRTIGLGINDEKRLWQPFDVVIIDDLNDYNFWQSNRLKELTLNVFNDKIQQVVVTSNQPIQYFHSILGSTLVQTGRDSKGDPVWETQGSPEAIRLTSRLTALLQRSGVGTHGVLEFDANIPIRRK